MRLKRAIVTGATGGIGRALCNQLLSDGYQIDIVGRKEPALRALEAELSATYPTAIVRTVVCDFTDEKSFANVDLGTPIDALILMPPQPPAHGNESTSSSEWATLFSESFTGPLLFLEHLLPSMKRAEKGKIVIVSGITSVQVLGTHPTSPAIRGAWRAQAKALALRLGQYGISVNTLSLGGVLTAPTLQRLKQKAQAAGISLEDQMKLETSNVPLGRYATPEMVGTAISTLLSTFSDHITGNNVICDGGFIRTY